MEEQVLLILFSGIIGLLSGSILTILRQRMVKQYDKAKEKEKREEKEMKRRLRRLEKPIDEVFTQKYGDAEINIYIDIDPD